MDPTNKIYDKNNTFDLSYVGDLSTIHKGDQSFYNPMEDSFLENKNM